MLLYSQLNKEEGGEIETEMTMEPFAKRHGTRIFKIILKPCNRVQRSDQEELKLESEKLTN
jgi:hypothetical protein